MNILRINFYELYQRHLCRHSQFGLNLWHVLSVYGVYFSIYSLVAFLIRTLLPEFTPTELAEAYRTSTDRQLSRAMGRRAVNWRIQDSPTRTSGAAKRKRRRRTCCSQTPAAVVQEIYGLLPGHYVIRKLMCETALIAVCEPRDLSFVNTLKILRCHLSEVPRSANGIRLWYATFLEEVAEQRNKHRRDRVNPRVIKGKMNCGR